DVLAGIGGAEQLQARERGVADVADQIELRRLVAALGVGVHIVDERVDGGVVGARQVQRGARKRVDEGEARGAELVKAVQLDRIERRGRATDRGRRGGELVGAVEEL